MTRVARIRCDACGHQAGWLERVDGRLELRYRYRRSPSPVEVEMLEAAGEEPRGREAMHGRDDLDDLRTRGVWPGEVQVVWPCNGCGIGLELLPQQADEATAGYARTGRPPTLRVIRGATGSTT